MGTPDDGAVIEFLQYGDAVQYRRGLKGGLGDRTRSLVRRRIVSAVFRAGAGPHFLEARTFRFRAHSMFDPERYREKSEVELWKQRDPIDTLRARMVAEGLLADADVAAMEEAIALIVDDSVEFAEASPLEELADLELFVHSPDSSVVRLAPMHLNARKGERP